MGSRLTRPSLVDAFFAILLLVVFARPVSWEALLADGDTGWHIRTGEWILSHAAVPATDLFSFSRAGEPWFAWEWLADVILAISYRCYGLPGVVGLAAVVLCLSGAVLMAWLLRRGAAHPAVRGGGGAEIGRAHV